MPCSDVPMIDTVIVEEPNPRHPYGVRGVGETPIVPEPAIERRHAIWLKSLKKVLQSRAATLGVPAPLLAQTRTLEALIAAAAAGNDVLPEELRGWRGPAIGDQLRAALEGIAKDG